MECSGKWKVEKWRQRQLRGESTTCDGHGSLGIPAGIALELKTEQILTGCRADQKKKNGAGSRADFKILPFSQFYAVFMPFSCR